MIEELRKNVDTEIGMVQELYKLSKRMEIALPYEKKIIQETINSLKKNIKTINNSIPKLLTNITIAKRLQAQPKKTELEKISFEGKFGSFDLTLSSKDKKNFLSEISTTDNLLSRIKKQKGEIKGIEEEFKDTREYIKISNIFFLDIAKNILKTGKISEFEKEIKKAGMDILVESYIAAALFSAFISFFAGIAIAILLMFFEPSIAFPFFSLYTGSILVKIKYLIIIPPILSILTLIGFYLYPSSEKDSLGKKIDQELPFAVMYMSTISGAGVEPSSIFRVIGTSREYPNIRKEVGKILNQINVYGYDLVTALNNAAKTTPSQKFAALLSGIATTVSSGGDLTNFFQKRTESLLLLYRLEREKYTKLAETFMDVYISLVIAAPMILLLLLVMLAGTSLLSGFSGLQMAIIMVLIVALMNVIFLAFLHLKQPAY